MDRIYVGTYSWILPLEVVTEHNNLVLFDGLSVCTIPGGGDYPPSLSWDTIPGQDTWIVTSGYLAIVWKIYIIQYL